MDEKTEPTNADNQPVDDNSELSDEQLDDVVGGMNATDGDDGTGRSRTAGNAMDNFMSGKHASDSVGGKLRSGRKH